MIFWRYFIDVFRPNREGNPHKPSNFNIRVMHGINRVSIVMFLLCMLVLAYRAFFR
jgi:hypothetical protein